MQSMGMKPNKDFKAQWLNPREVAQALQDKTIDAGFIYIADPTGLIIELASRTPIKFIQLDLKKVLKNRPYWYKTKVKAGTYKGIDKDYVTQGANVILITHKDTDPNLVYEVTKALYQHSDEVGAVHPAGKEWISANAARGVVIPFHPGAAKYLKEIGAIK